MAISVKDILLKIGIDVSQFDSGMTDVTNKLKKHQKAIGLGMIALGGVILAGFGMSAKAAADFGSAMHEVNTMMGLTRDEFAAFSKDIQNLASDLGVDAVDSAKALYQAISAGVPKENAIEFLTIATKAAIAGVTSTEVAVDGLTTVINAFKLTMSDAQKVADIMFTTVKGGKTTFEELSAALFNVAPIAAAAGVSFEEVAAALASITKQGVPTSVATTQLRAAIQAVTAPTERQTKMIEELGLEFGTAALEAKGLQGMFDDIARAADGDMAVLRRLVMSVEAVQAILALTGKNSEVFTADLKAMTEAEGAATEAFLEMEESLGRQKKAVDNIVKSITISIGNILIPILKEVFETIKPVIESIKEWVEVNPGLTKTIVLGAVALGALLMASGSLLRVMPGIIALTTALSISVNSLIWPITLLVAAIGAVVIALGFMKATQGITKLSAEDLARVLKDARVKLEELKDAGKGASDEAESLRKRIVSLTSALKDLNVVVGDSGEIEKDWQDLFSKREEAISRVERAERRLSNTTGLTQEMLKTWEREWRKATLELLNIETALADQVVSTEDLAEAYRNTTPEQKKFLDVLVMEKFELGLTTKAHKAHVDEIKKQAEGLTKKLKDEAKKQLDDKIKSLEAEEKAVNDTYNNEVEAITKKYGAAKDSSRTLIDLAYDVRDARIQAIEDEMVKARTAHEDRVWQINEQYRLSVSDAERSIQNEIDAIDQQTKREELAITRLAESNRTSELEAAILAAGTAEESAELQEELAEHVARVKRNELLRSREDEKQYLRDQIRELREGTSAQAKELEKARARKLEEEDVFYSGLEKIRIAAALVEEAAAEAELAASIVRLEIERDKELATAKEILDSAVADIEERKLVAEGFYLDNIERMDEELKKFIGDNEVRLEDAAEFVKNLNLALAGIDDVDYTVTRHEITEYSGIEDVLPGGAGGHGATSNVSTWNPQVSSNMQTSQSALRSALQSISNQTANIIVELDGQVLARAMGEPLVDLIRVKAGIRGV